MGFLAYSLPLLMLVSALAVKLAAPRLGEGVARISVAASAVVLALGYKLFEAWVRDAEGAEEAAEKS